MIDGPISHLFPSWLPLPKTSGLSSSESGQLGIKDTEGSKNLDRQFHPRENIIPPEVLGKLKFKVAKEEEILKVNNCLEREGNLVNSASAKTRSYENQCHLLSCGA